ncbi:nitrate regulatory protein [Pseudohongiella sp. O18]|uniref:nitrate regulatory protein n=1 Tax=Pseudohongiella sp. O18 TaxID=2904248 RepID=UPI001F313189|nr:nitrate regulatory protein [Pseudohongiella sp. O18]
MSAADFLVASKRCEIQGLTSFLALGELVSAIGALVHALQRERGASNVYLASGGQDYQDRLQVIQKQVDSETGSFHLTLSRANAELGVFPGGARLFSRIASAVHLLTGIAVLRDQVLSRKLALNKVTDAYSQVIQSLLGVVFETADAASDPAITRGLVALFNFMQGKELAGQERAVGSAGFAARQFTADQVSRLQHLVESQERCFEVFAQFADERSLRLWSELGSAAIIPELKGLRALAARGGSLGDESLADRWFRIATERIDAMYDIEQKLQLALKQLCQVQLSEARQLLDCNQLALEELDRQAGPDNTVFLVPVSAADANSSVTEQPPVGRSMMELLQFQARRLQEMGAELDAAKSALEERKVLERAKLILMKHRGLNEDEAYRALRQAAMNQSRRLTDVARSVIEMADILQP